MEIVTIFRKGRNSSHLRWREIGPLAVQLEADHSVCGQGWSGDSWTDTHQGMAAEMRSERARIEAGLRKEGYQQVAVKIDYRR